MFHSRSPDRRTLFLMLFSLVLLCGGGLSIGTSLDIGLAHQLAALKLPTLVQQLVMFSEVFAHGLPVAVILVVVASLDRRSWRMVPRLALASYGAGLMANLIKLSIGRGRPRAYGRDGLPETSFETFLGWFPALENSSAWRSFPSGHAAVATGLAVALIYVYPKGRKVFCMLALLACTQRLVSHAHFLSDVLVSAALGCLIGAFCTGRNRLAQGFDRLEGESLADPPQPKPRPPT